MEIFRGHKKRVLLILAVVFVIEIFVFNYRHWGSWRNKEIPAGNLILGSGYQDNGNGTYTVVGDDLCIEVKDINCILHTSRIELAVLNREGEMPGPITIWQWVTDESHKIFYGLPEREIWENEKRSGYMSYHLYGKCTGLKIVPAFLYGQVISFKITLNPRIPLFFSWERVLALVFLFGIVAYLRPSSNLHKVSYLNLPYRIRNMLLVLFFLAHGALFWWLVNVNPYFQEEIGDNQKQYQALAESLKEGQFFLAEEPPLALQNMENPYDYEYRNQVMNEAGQWYKWDHAYFNGKYYVYFGVVPAILFYLPCYLATGSHLHNCTAVFLLLLLFLAGVLGNVHEIIRKWFPNVSLAVWFMLVELILMGSGSVYMAKRPDLYTVPILSGLTFGLLGLWCYFKAVEKEGVSLKYLVAGSLFTALVVGGRPQLMVFLLPAFIVLGKDLLAIENNAGKGKAFLAFLVPMATVAAGLMYYNYSRFGSVFDFGANYNLTFNDMRNRGFYFDRIPLGAAAYLFWPVRLTLKFPFLEAVYFDSQYMGITIQEATYGGIFMTNLFSWFCILPVFFSRKLKECQRAAWQFSIACLFSAGMVIVADTNMSGILQRYFGDFSVFVMLSSALSALLVLSCLQTGEDGLKRMVAWLLLVCLIGGGTYQAMAFFLDTGEALKDLRPDLYSHVKYLAAFWL